jgi:hypothetical protein
MPRECRETQQFLIRGLGSTLASLLLSRVSVGFQLLKGVAARRTGSCSYDHQSDSEQPPDPLQTPLVRYSDKQDHC